MITTEYQSSMRVAFSPSLRIVAGLILAALLSVAGYDAFVRTSRSPRAMLERADELSWLNSWIAAAPIYREAEAEFGRRGDSGRALYARVSQIPAQSESSTRSPDQIAVLRNDLDLPDARDPETRLRILTILGMLETNYDAEMARETWVKVRSLALAQHHLLLASRAVGEEGIAAFLLGDIATARKDVGQAWLVAKFADPGARIRYASMYGTGLVELHKFKEANVPLDEAIRVAVSTRNAAYPSIAVDAKIEALSGTGRNAEALALANDAMQKGCVTSSRRAFVRALSSARAGLRGDERLESSGFGPPRCCGLCETTVVLAWRYSSRRLFSGSIPAHRRHTFGTDGGERSHRC